MTKPRCIPWTEAEWESLKETASKCSTSDEATTEHNKKYPYRSIASIREKCNREGITLFKILGKSLDPKELGLKRSEKNNDKQELSRLRAENSKLVKQLSTSDRYIETIHEVKRNVSKPPRWIVGSDTKKNTGIPVLFITDAHGGEVVERAQIGGVNQYNMDICAKRIEHTFKTAVLLTKHYMKNPNYPGICIPIGGDMMSGNIHEELEATNEEPTHKIILWMEGLLASGIALMEKEFGKVFVPCVVGNHGRVREKKRYKNKIYDNYDWLLYQMLARRFASNPNITFMIPESPDCLFSIYNTKFLLNHGDEFKGGSGISGIYTPLSLGRHRKLGKQTAMNNSFDVMLIGHFHQYIHTNNLIVGGSVKGYDEFANGLNLPFERPQQALFVVNPELGITYRMPILCDGYDKEKKEWNGKAIKTF